MRERERERVCVCVCVFLPAQLGQACEPACHWRVLVCIQKKGGGETRGEEEKVEGEEWGGAPRREGECLVCGLSAIA